MKNELENLSKSELIDRLLLMEKTIEKQQSVHQRKLSQSTTQLRVLNKKLVQRDEQIAVYKRLIFGARRERYIAPASSQMSLPFEATAEQKKESEARHTQRIEYTRGKTAARKHPGRVSLPDHLPVEQVIIDPPGDLSDKVCIGRLVTDKLEMIPAKAFIKRYIRNKYVDRGNPDAGVLVGDLPDEVSDKSIAGPSVMAQVITDKFCDHLPLYRQQQRFSRHGITIAASTLGNWVQTGGDYLQIFYEHYVEHTKSQGYLQIDETPIPVLDRRKKAKRIRGITGSTTVR